METIQKPIINIAIIGHVDSGKSTTCGHLLYKLGKISTQDLKKIEKEAQHNNKLSFLYAYIMDKSKASRQQGITITPSYSQITTQNRTINLIDVPGHRDFIKNMIGGTSQSDAALLIVSAKQGEFEAGFAKGGQTGEHSLLAYGFGIRKMVIGINKMDVVDFSQARFDEIQAEVGRYLGKIGFKKDDLSFVPISGFGGDNLVDGKGGLSWWQGGTLCEIFDRLQPPHRPIDKDLRISVQGTCKIQGIGTIVTGRVESGVLKQGMQIQFAPGNKVGEVKSIEAHHQSLQEALPGDNIGFNLRNISDKDIKKGFIAGDQKHNPPKECTSFIAKVIIINHPGEIKNGYSPLFLCHSSNFCGQIEKILAKIDKKTGLNTEEFPQNLKSGDCALIQVKPKKSVCVENFSDFSSLGRIAIRDGKETVGIGVIKEVIY